MFGQIWKWAGKYRTTPRNLGVAPWDVGPQTRLLLEDARYWLAHASYGTDECALRLHHRLVAVHPFANGNGRHARMMADLVAHSRDVRRFSWGRANLCTASVTRGKYIDSLHAADAHQYGPLLEFGRS